MVEECQRTEGLSTTKIMLGSMNPIYCVYLSLAIFLEQWIGGGAGIGSQWLFSDGITTPQSSEEDIGEIRRLS